MTLDDRAREAAAAARSAVEGLDLCSPLPGTTPSRGDGPLRWVAAAAVVLAVALVAGLAARGDDAGTEVAEVAAPTTSPVPSTPPADAVASPPFRLASALQPFDDCEALVAFAEEQALEQVTPYGLSVSAWSGDFTGRPVDRLATAAPDLGGPPTDAGGLAPSLPPSAPVAAGTPAAAPLPPTLASRPAPQSPDGAGSAPSTQFSETNVQEVGVDEPDLVKTDGELLVALARGRLQVVDVSGDQPRLTGSLPVDGRSVLLAGDRALVLGDVGGDPVPVDFRGSPSTVVGSVLTLVDLSDPAAPEVVSTMRIEGGMVDARLVGGIARVVHSTPPEPLPVTFPSAPGGPAAEQLALEANRSAVRASTEQTWVPAYTLDEGDPTPLVDCGDVARPEQPASLGMLSVLTLDLAAGLEPLDSVGVVGAGETVYASSTGLYVTSPTDDFGATSIHKLDSGDPTRTSYLASGEVRGTLLSQYSLSEHEGVLRVASTDGPETYVTALGERDGGLVELGQVGGIGRDEQVQAVRFVGEQGYVVTFRRTDPLFVLDLADPTAPRVAGELEVPGYSAYLHPLGDGLLLGVGQDATLEGRILGTQVSLFDVSDPATPTRLQHRTFAGAQSEVELDPHAFFLDPDRSTVVLPLAEASGFLGAVGLRVEPAGIDEVGRAEHPGALVRRTVRIGDTLLTVSDAGVEAGEPATLEERAYLGFEG